MPSTTHPDLLAEVVRVVCARIARGSMEAAAVPDLIRVVFAALSLPTIEPLAAKPLQHQPAVPIKRSIRPDHLVCLEDGRRLKMLKRHLRVVYGMTPAEYRARWGLPHDYPMTAPNASAERSERARAIRARAQSHAFATPLEAA